ncbi:hypothetical protein ElyMa_002458200 [Elysia marginata]|uniref:Uncharacterized protein n=1 Tax=Elysia marginata TaxID=1093978 RepID=A0AAV4GM32_9GAST|nr:hypothetical protein ElyMa_002458200 [Elysia marginata]
MNDERDHLSLICARWIPHFCAIEYSLWPETGRRQRHAVYPAWSLSSTSGQHSTPVIKERPAQSDYINIGDPLKRSRHYPQSNANCLDRCRIARCNLNVSPSYDSSEPYLLSIFRIRTYSLTHIHLGQDLPLLHPPGQYIPSRQFRIPGLPQLTLSGASLALVACREAITWRAHVPGLAAHGDQRRRKVKKKEEDENDDNEDDDGDDNDDNIAAAAAAAAAAADDDDDDDDDYVGSKVDEVYKKENKRETKMR